MDRYVGVDLRPGMMPADIQALARRARFGDPQAQYELGLLYENGARIPKNLRTAEQLYSLAAAPQAAVYGYSPGVNGSPGQVVQIKSAVPREGLAIAAERLARLRERR